MEPRKAFKVSYLLITALFLFGSVSIRFRSEFGKRGARIELVYAD